MHARNYMYWQEYVPVWQKQCKDGGCNLIPCHFQASTLAMFPVVSYLHYDRVSIIVKYNIKGTIYTYALFSCKSGYLVNYHGKFQYVCLCNCMCVCVCL